MKKAIRSMISTVLAIVLAIGMMPVATFADTTELPQLNYVFLGDSMSQGYMFTDYVDEYCGLRGASARSSVALFRKYLEDNSGCNVNTTDLSIQGFTPSMLWAMIKGFSGKDEEIEKLMLSFNDARYLGYYKSAMVEQEGKSIEERYQIINNYFLDNIKQADVLVYDIGMGNFGIYMLDRLRGVLSGSLGAYSWENLTTLMDCMTSCQKKAVTTLKKNLVSTIDSLGVLPSNIASLANEIVETITYGYASMIYYNDKVIDWIYRNNKNGNDLKMIVSGLYNPLTNVVINIPAGDTGKTIRVDISELLESCFDAASLYATSTNKYSHIYTYAELQSEQYRLETFVSEYARCANDPNQKLSVDAKCNAYSVIDGSVHGNELRSEAVKIYGKKQSKLTKKQKKKKQTIEKFAKVCCESMVHDSYDVQDFINALAGSTDYKADILSIVNKINEKKIDTITEAEYRTLNLALLFSGARSFGCHPSPQGQYNKYLSFVNAYEDFAAGKTAKIETNKGIGEYIIKSGNKIYNFIAENDAAAMQTLTELAVNNGWLKEKYATEINGLVDKIVVSMNSGNIKKAHELCNSIATIVGEHSSKSVESVLSNQLVKKIIRIRLEKSQRRTNFKESVDSFFQGLKSDIASLF